MSPLTSTPSTATPEQLVYLWLLADQTGTTFKPARTRQQARREIQLLIELKENREIDPDLSPQRRSAWTSLRSEREPFELGRYQTQGGEQRALYCVFIKSKPHLVDAAADGPGCMYTVKERLCKDYGDNQLEQIAAAYIAKAQRLGRIPMTAR